MIICIVLISKKRLSLDIWLEIPDQAKNIEVIIRTVEAKKVYRC